MRSLVGWLAGPWCVGLALMAGVASAETGSAASPGEALAAALGGSWQVTIEGEARSRTLTVFDLAPTGFGARGDGHTLDAVYGFSDGTHSPVKVIATGALEDAQITFRSPAGATVRARTAAGGELHGTFEFKGRTRPVVLRRAPVTAIAKRDSRITLIYVGAYN